MIIEERRSRIENNPVRAARRADERRAYLSHPYGIPVIGWEHEMAKLSRETRCASTSATTRPTTPSSSSPAT